MGIKAELETQLRDAPDVTTLAVYADLLGTEGDPRGELITLELQRPERHALLFRWLASHLKLSPGGDHLHVCDESWIPFLASPIGEFCRGAVATTKMEDAKRLVDAIIQKPRPFMTRFKLYAGGGGPLVFDTRHVAAMPNLVELDLDGDFDLRGFRHPRVTRVSRRSWSLNGLTSWTLPLDLPSCEELVIDAKPWSPKVDPARVQFAGLPRLRLLDVSECEPQFVPTKNQRDRTNLDVLGWLLHLTWLPQLERLRLPSVRTAEQAKQLAALIARAPRVSIDVVRTYSRCAAGLSLASDKVRFAPPWPWLPSDREHDRWKFRLTAPGITIDMLSGAIGDGLTRVFDGGDDEFRELWRTIWRALDACERKPVRLPYGLLHRGFSGFSEQDYGSSTSLRNQVLALSSRLSPEQLVTISAA